METCMHTHKKLEYEHDDCAIKLITPLGTYSVMMVRQSAGVQTIKRPAQLHF